MKKPWLKMIIALILLGFCANLDAKLPALEDPLVRADLGAEHNRGASNTVAGLGNGGLTVGISPWSEVVYFRWPSPSRYEQLRYFTYAPWLRDPQNKKDTRYSDDAPSPDWQRYGRPYEPFPGLGARGGIYLQDGSLAWFGDPSWNSARSYEPEWSSVLCTSLTRPGAKIKVCQWVDWNNDLLIQDFQVDSLSAQKFFYYGTFDPYDRSFNFRGEPDLRELGFATVYLADSGIILCFRPAGLDRARLAAALVEKFTPELIDQLYPEGGYFVAMGFQDLPDGFQVGADRKGKGGQTLLSAQRPLAASEDAKNGRLQGSRYYFGMDDSGLEKSLSSPNSRISVLISAGPSARQAVSIIQNARGQGMDALRKKALADWKPMADQVYLPEKATAMEKRVARRSILNLFVGRDKKSGAIVAAPTRQPAYHFDWPRDGAFFDLSLDLAGFSEAALSHLDFYRRTQRKERFGFNLLSIFNNAWPFYVPRGHFYNNIYTNGDQGRIKDMAFEIDQTALLTWDLWRHEKFIPQAERSAYQKKFLEMLTLAGDALANSVDEKNGWTKKASEDDNARPRATLHGAASVLAGLCAAVDAGTRWGADPAKIARWRKAAVALREGMLRRVSDEKTLDQSGWRGIQWSLYPAPVFVSYDDPRAKKLIERLANNVEENIYKKRPGFAYLGEQVFILCIAASQMPQYQKLTRDAVKVLTSEVPIPGADSFGEATLWLDLPDGSQVAQQRTSIPHLWTGVTAYLSVMALYEPERFMDQVPPIPK